jgi:hypothetical protein
MVIRRKIFSKRASSHVLGGAVGGPEIDKKRDEKKAKRLAEKKKWNTGEHVGSVATKAGLATAGIGGAALLGGSALAGGAAANALRKGTAGVGHMAAAGAGATTAALGAKAGKIGLGIAAAGAITKGISKAVRKSKEEVKEK